MIKDDNKRRLNFVSLSKLECGLKKSTPGKFADIRHFQRIGINATKFEKTLIHFKSDVFAAVAVVDAKTPRSWESAGLLSGRSWVQSPAGPTITVFKELARSCRL